MEIALFFLQVEDTFSKTSKYHNFIVNLTIHTVPNCSILSNNKYNPGQLIQKPGFWLSSRPFWIRITFIWVHQGPPVIVLIFFFYYCYYIEFSNMESKPNFAKVNGPWWTQIKIVLIHWLLRHFAQNRVIYWIEVTRSKFCIFWSFDFQLNFV